MASGENSAAVVNAGSAAPAASAGSSTPAAAPTTNWWTMMKGFFIRMLIIYMISSFFRRNPQTPAPGSTPANTHGGKSGAGAPNSLFNGPASNLYMRGDWLDMWAFVKEEQFDWTDSSTGGGDLNGGEGRPYDFKKAQLFWHLTSIRYGDWSSGPNQDGNFVKLGNLTMSGAMQRENASLHLTVFFVKAGNSPNPADGARYDPYSTFRATQMLTKYKKRRISNTQNLLSGLGLSAKQSNLTKETSPYELFASSASVSPESASVSPESDVAAAQEIPFQSANAAKPTTSSSTDKLANATVQLAISHWHPNLTINLLDDHTQWIRGSVPPPLNEVIEFHSKANYYYPMVYLNNYWNLHQDYQPINASVPHVELRLTFAPISLFKLQLYVTQTMRNKMYSGIFGDAGQFMMQESDEEKDTLKKTLLETNPYLLALTVVISLVHSVFEFLAFKNDIQFWRSRESLKGLSVRSVFFSVFQSLIVVLYVFDNEDTNFMVKVSVFIGLLIELWKIKKVVNVQLDPTAPLRIRFSYKASYVDSSTKTYDQMAFRYLAWLLFPVLLGYAAYSLVYLEHRGWYSWLLSMLYGFLLMFGFIMMTPQLFINYKLKSVAHLPWRMLTYKALNTFIDDIFAFVIRMPTLYRIGCLRDDVIFFIYLYQKWIYPIDPTRPNEFGVSQEMLEKKTDGPVGGAEALPETSESIDIRSNGDATPADAVATESEDKEEVVGEEHSTGEAESVTKQRTNAANADQ